MSQENVEVTVENRQITRQGALALRLKTATVSKLALTIVASIAIFLAAPAGSASAEQLQYGEITEFSAGLNANSDPEGIAPGPDGNMWFADGPWIGRITPAGAITEFSARGSAATGIAPGPDGNMWFSDVFGSIGRITPAGAITEFRAGLDPSSSPQDIAPGPDGNLWFADFSPRGFGQPDGSIGRITPAGAITEFSAGIPHGWSPTGIAQGPDGNLWFTNSDDSGANYDESCACEVDGAAIGRITPAGAITEFNAGLKPDSVPEGIAPGPDGNLWFTDGSWIGRITPAGAITEFSARGSASTAIAPGPDGNMWFVDGSLIRRITPAGAITGFALEAINNSPVDIAPGPDGNMWFTDRAIERIIVNPRAVSNSFSFGKLKLNRGSGTATLTVNRPGPGLFVLTGKGLVRQQTQGVELPVKPKGKAKRELDRTGKATVRAKITYTPTGGLPKAKLKRITLLKRR
jgi:virginiamycin B lyase